jgi:hypothetical protein
MKRQEYEMYMEWLANKLKVCPCCGFNLEELVEDEHQRQRVLDQIDAQVAYYELEEQLRRERQWNPFEDPF